MSIDRVLVPHWHRNGPIGLMMRFSVSYSHAFSRPPQGQTTELWNWHLACQKAGSLIERRLRFLPLES